MSRRRHSGVFVAVGFGVALALAFFVSPHASSKPDGLEKVATEQKIDTLARQHTLAGSPTAGYEVHGVHDRSLSTGLAGLIGVAVVFALTGALFVVVRRAGGATSSDEHADA